MRFRPPHRSLRARCRYHLLLATGAGLAGLILTFAVAWTTQRIARPMWDRADVSIGYGPDADRSAQRSVCFQLMRNRWQSRATVSRATRYHFDLPIASVSGLTPSQRTAAERTRAILPSDDLRRTPIVRDFGIGWATFPPNDDDNPPEIRGIVTIAYGWPCRALCHVDDATVRNGALAVRCSGLLETSFGEFAYKPIYRGLAFNSTFYGAIVWAMLVVPGLARSMHRRRHDRCVHCGYDRAGLGTALCPECGR